MVQSVGEKICSQEAQEERQEGSIHDLSGVPSVHRSLKGVASEASLDTDFERRC